MTPTLQSTAPVNPVAFARRVFVSGAVWEYRIFDRNPLPACLSCEDCCLTELQNGQFFCMRPEPVVPLRLFAEGGAL